MGYQRLTAELCTKLSYRESVKVINLFQHRPDSKAVRLRTLTDSMERIGGKISAALEETTEKVLERYGFDSETGLPQEGISLSESITAPSIPERTEEDIQALRNAIDSVNASREEKIPFAAEELDIESMAAACVYVSIDEVGVKHQKDSRKPDAAKGAKYVEHTVAHIQQGQSVYVLTASSMKTAMKSVLAFLLFNGLLHHKLVFFTDGARNIKKSINELFSFHPFTVILDWFHLKKKCQELLSMALKGKDVRNNILEKLLRILWVGDVKSAINYLESLPSSAIRNQKWLEEQIGYLKRKEPGIVCYAARATLRLRNSSNPVEKENDLLVAQRQKHNGMAWSQHGSCALAAIEMVFHNSLEDAWFQQGQVPFLLPKDESPIAPSAT